MDAGRRSTVGREVCLLELAAYCRSRLVQSCLLEEDLLGGDCYCVAETSTAAAGKRRLLLVLPLQLGKIPGAAAIRRKRLKFSACQQDAAETNLLLLLWRREEAPAGLD
ncbi:hypothetical protein Peur_006829 [Populus x canadensis]